jgi:light-regulated signal transduction histidine kinase (bacteriophytochrome)
MSAKDFEKQVSEAAETIRDLQDELAESDRGLLAVVLELETLLDERTKELRAAHAELERTNYDVLQSTLELEASNGELEAFSYSVSHDLRAPLRAIEGFCGLLIEDHAAQLNDKGQEYLQHVRAAVQRMHQLIEDLLSLSRITQLEMKRTSVDLARIVKAIVTDLKRSDPNRTIEFVIVESANVTGDMGLLRIALENLMGNAWKFTGKTENARIEFGYREEDNAYFVRDNGAGFDMAYARRLFGAFQRLHHQRDFPGTGIGLATVQRIIHRHGGRVWAEAAPGQGATFYFTL